MMKYIVFCGLFLSTIITTPAQDTLIPYRVKNKWGYSDYNGKIKIKPQYDSVSFFGNVSLPEVGYLTVVAEKNQLGLINNKGKLVIPMIYENIDVGFDHGEWVNCIIAKSKGKYGAVNSTNRILLPFNYDSIVLKEKYKTPGDYNTYIGYDYAVQQKQQYFLINNKTKKKTTITKATFDKIEEENWTMADRQEVSESRLTGIINNKEAIVMRNKGKIDNFENSWIKITDWSEPCFIVYLNGKLGLVQYNELENSTIENFYIPLVHDEVLKIEKSVLLRKGNEKWWYNDNGKFVIALKENETVNKMSFDYLTIEKMGKIGLATFDYKKNKPSIIQPKYEAIDFENSWFNIFKVKLNGKLGYINTDGFEYFSN